jgi:LysR family cyn operon transcriptional activator
MDLRQLRSFLAVAEAGGFTRAAARLRITQPALSRQVRDLERELGLRLFDRIGRVTRLTGEGADLLRRTRALLTDTESLRERARALRGGDAGILSVGTTPQTLESVLSPFLSRYRRRHPGVEVFLTEDGGPRVLADLERGDLQLAITVEDGRFPSRRLFPALATAVMTATHALARLRVVEVRELADAPLLLLRRDFGTRQWFDSACAAAQIRPRVVLESSSPHTLLALAGDGHGIAIVPSNVLVPRRPVRVAPVVQGGAPLGGWVSAAWNPRRFLPPYAEAFVTELVRFARRYPGRAVVRRAPPLARSLPLATVEPRPGRRPPAG